MSVSLYAASVEDATITLTNCEATSDKDLLKWRDNRVLGVNSPTVSGDTRQIRCNFGDSSSVNYYILGNLTTSAGVEIKFYQNSGGFTLHDTVSDTTYTNENLLVTIDSTELVGDFRIDIVPGTTSSVTFSHIFMGIEYDFPVNYQPDNNRGFFNRFEKDADILGYSYSQIHDTTSKQIYDFGFHLTEGQITSLKNQFASFGWGAKRFWIKDTAVDSDIHLVEWVGDPQLKADNIAAGYYNVPFKAREV